MIPEELTNKPTLSNEDMEIILDAFSLLEFPNYNINPRDVDYAFLYQVDKLEKTFHREPIELQRRKGNLLEKCRICSASAKRPNLLNEILEYKKRQIKADSHFIPFKHFKDFFINFWSDLKIFKYRIFDKPLQLFTHISVLLISFGKNVFILFLKNGWEFMYSLFTSPAITQWLNKNWKTKLFTNFISMIISFALFVTPICFIKVGYDNITEFWNDQITDVKNLPKEDLKGYISKNYIIVSDKLGEKEILAIPFGTEIEYRKVNIGKSNLAYYIPKIDSYIFNEEVVSSTPSIVKSKIFTLMEEENQYIPIQQYTKKIPTRKIELFSGNFRITDETGSIDGEGIYEINKGFIFLDSTNFQAKLKYTKEGSFEYSKTRMK